MEFAEVAADIIKAMLQMGAEIDDETMFLLQRMIVRAMSAAWDSAVLESMASGPLHGLN
jgi:hypothetical protein